MSKRKLIPVVVVAAVVGVLLGVGTRVIAGKRTGPKTTAELKEAAKTLRHDLGAKIYVTDRGILRVEGTYRVNPGHRRRAENTSVHLKVLSEVGEVVWDDELGKYTHQPAGQGTYPIQVDLPVPPGRYTVCLWVQDQDIRMTNEVGVVGPFVIASKQTRVDVK